MATLVLRGLPADLMARLRDYARRKAVSPRDAAERLLESGLRVHERAVQAGAASAAAKSAEERQEAARRAGQAGGRGRPRDDVRPEAAAASITVRGDHD